MNTETMSVTSKRIFYIAVLGSLLLCPIYTFSQKENKHTDTTHKAVQHVQVNFPVATGWVNDFEEVIDSTTESKITRLIQAHNDRTSNQISIVTISSIAPYDYLADFTKDLSNAWGVGEKGKNNGVTIIYSKALHEVRIATGLGLENKITDAICQKIVDEYMLPAFKTENYGKGLLDGVTELISVLEK
jgi:uncharacterized protein